MAVAQKQVMHCPNCGNESSLKQNFCRKCGFDLVAVSELIRGKQPTEPTEVARKLDRAEHEAMVVRHMFRWIGWGIMVLGIGVLMLVVNKSFDLGKLFGLASSLFLLGGVGMALYGIISAIGKGVSPSLKVTDAEQRELDAPTTQQLEGGAIPVPIPSVTERTTELIGKKSNSR